MVLNWTSWETVARGELRVPGDAGPMPRLAACRPRGASAAAVAVSRVLRSPEGDVEDKAHEARDLTGQRAMPQSSASGSTGDVEAVVREVPADKRGEKVAPRARITGE